MGITPTGEFSLTIDIVKSDFGIQTDPEAVKKLLRVGTDLLTLDYTDQIDQIATYKNAVSKLSHFVAGERYQYRHLSDELDLPIGATQGSQETYRIIWFQKYIIDQVAEILEVPQSKIAIWCVLLAADELSRQDYLKANLGDDIEDRVEIVEDAIDEQEEECRRVAIDVILHVAHGEHQEEAFEMLRRSIQ